MSRDATSCAAGLLSRNSADNQCRQSVLNISAEDHSETYMHHTSPHSKLSHLTTNSVRSVKTRPLLDLLPRITFRCKAVL